MTTTESLPPIDAVDRFAEELDRMMGEYGIDGRTCPRDRLRLIVAECFAEQVSCYDEFILWVMYGDDARARTLALLRGGRREYHAGR